MVKEGRGLPVIGSEAGPGKATAQPRLNQLKRGASTQHLALCEAFSAVGGLRLSVCAHRERRIGSSKGHSVSRSERSLLPKQQGPVDNRNGTGETIVTYPRMIALRASFPREKSPALCGAVWVQAALGVSCVCRWPINH